SFVSFWKPTLNHDLAAIPTDFDQGEDATPPCKQSPTNGRARSGTSKALSPNASSDSITTCSSRSCENTFTTSDLSDSSSDCCTPDIWRTGNSITPSVASHRGQSQVPSFLISCSTNSTTS